MPEQLGRILLIGGLVLAAVGGILLLAGRFGIGRLPGDIVWRGENWTVYFPLGWMIVLSIVLTLILTLFSRGR